MASSGFVFEVMPLLCWFSISARFSAVMAEAEFFAYDTGMLCGILSGSSLSPRAEIDSPSIPKLYVCRLVTIALIDDYAPGNVDYGFTLLSNT